MITAQAASASDAGSSQTATRRDLIPQRYGTGRAAPDAESVRLAGPEVVRTRRRAPLPPLWSLGSHPRTVMRHRRGRRQSGRARSVVGIAGSVHSAAARLASRPREEHRDGSHRDCPRQGAQRSFKRGKPNLVVQRNWTPISVVRVPLTEAVCRRRRRAGVLRNLCAYETPTAVIVAAIAAIRPVGDRGGDCARYPTITGKPPQAQERGRTDES